MTKSRGATLGRTLVGAAVLVVGVLSNLGSNFVGGGDPQIGSCVEGSQRLVLEGDGQTGAAGAPLGKTLRVTYTCNGYQGTKPRDLVFRPIVWTASNGRVDGLASTTSTTDADGVAQANWSLAATVGAQTLTAAVELQPGVTVSAKFTASSVNPTPGGNCSTGIGTNFDSSRTVVGNETWTLAGSPYRGEAVEVTNNATLTIEPGVLVCLRSMSVRSGSRLQAQGQPGKEIRFSVADLTRNVWLLQLGTVNEFNPPASPSVIGHVWTDNMQSLLAHDHPVHISDSRFVFTAAARATAVCPKLTLRSSFGFGNGSSVVGSSVRRSVIDGYGDTPAGCEAAVVLDAYAPVASGPMLFEARVVRSVADAVLIKATRGTSAWSLRNCDISQSGRGGVVVDGDVGNGSGTLSGCSITNNVGLGIDNRRPNSLNVEARNNWWGDVAGPAGPLGDGVSTGVDASSPLAAPPTLGY
jgi:hypothetical protein